MQIEKGAEQPSPHAAQQPQVLFAYSYYPHCALPQGKKGRGLNMARLLSSASFSSSFCCCPSCLPVVVTLRVFSAFVCHCVGSHTTSYNLSRQRGVCVICEAAHQINCTAIKQKRCTRQFKSSKKRIFIASEQ